MIPRRYHAEILAAIRIQIEVDPGVPPVEGASTEYEDACMGIARSLGVARDCPGCGGTHFVDEFRKCSHCQRPKRGANAACAETLCSKCEKLGVSSGGRRVP